MAVIYKFVTYDEVGNKQYKRVEAKTYAEAREKVDKFDACYLVLPNGHEERLFSCH
jgi:hypothetical protein